MITNKNREATELNLLHAVGELVEECGFEHLGINAIAARAGVSKILIYRYFDSLEGLIAAYIRQNDFWINFNQELPDRQHLNTFLKEMFRQQITLLRQNYALKRLYRWELSSNNDMVKKLREKREENGLRLIDAISRITGRPCEEIAFLATLVTSSISYLALLEENCPVYNGIQIQKDAGWEKLEEGIDSLIDLLINRQ